MMTEIEERLENCSKKSDLWGLIFCEEVGMPCNDVRMNNLCPELKGWIKENMKPGQKIFGVGGKKVVSSR